MGIMDDLTKQLGGTGGGTEGHPGMISAIKGLLEGGAGGGLTGLIGLFQQKGLGETISSWISTGKNLPISPDQIQHVLGTDRIQQLAQQAGLSPEAAKTELAKLLPNVVDKVTPSGAVPAADLLQKALSLFR